MRTLFQLHYFIHRWRIRGVCAVCHKLSIFCKIIQLIYSTSCADLYSHNTVFELPVTPVMFGGDAVYQKLCTDFLQKLSQVCSEHKSKSTIMILSYKFAEDQFHPKYKDRFANMRLL